MGRHQGKENEKPLCVQVKTTRDWAVSTRVPYNHEKDDVWEWRIKINKQVRKLRGEAYYDIFTLKKEDPEIWVRWGGGEELLQVHHNLLNPLLHDYINDIMIKEFYHGTKFNIRRSAKPLEMVHIAPHPYSYMSESVRNSIAGGHKTILRFRTELKNPATFALAAPLLIWSERCYKVMAPTEYKKMEQVNQNRIDLLMCDLPLPNQIVLNSGNAHTHNDPKDSSLALLSYYHGPFQDCWTDGELHIKEMGMQIEPTERDTILIDGVLYHGVNPENGLRFNTTIYNNNLTQTAYLPEEMGWVTAKNFGYKM